jgi:hypothetical protein
VFQRRVFRTFFCRREKNDSIAALSLEEPTRPIDPRSPLFFSSRTTRLDLNWLPRSELSRIRLNSDYAEDDVKPRNRADASDSLGATLV